MKLSDIYAPLECPPPIDRKPRVIITAVQVPFVSGGAESHIESLRRELTARDYDADIVRLPFKWYPPRQMINDALAWRLLDLTHSYGLPVDLVIATRFPSYCVRHPRKVAWVLHQHRQAYDFLNSEMTDFTDTPDDDEVRNLLYEMDARSLNECRKIFTNSQNVTDRMKSFLDIDGEPLYHPPPLFGKYRTDGYEDYIFTAGRLEKNKRVDLLIRAMAETKNPVCAVIAGKGPMAPELETLVAEKGLKERVTFAGYISEDELLTHYARCGAVWYGPMDEDYGYVTLEAFYSRKPVITSDDSGGVLEFVEPGINGFISKPEPEAMASLIDQWWDNRTESPEMGNAGYNLIESLSWDHVIDKLTACLREDVRKEQQKDNK